MSSNPSWKFATGIRCVAAALGDDSGIVGCAAYAKARPAVSVA